MVSIIAKSKFLTGLRVYVQGTNLVTWTKWRGFDPEGSQATGFLTIQCQERLL